MRWWSLVLTFMPLAGCGDDDVPPDGARADGARDASGTLDVDDATAACVMFASCVGSELGPGGCFEQINTFTSEQIACLAGARECAAVRACVGMTTTPDRTCTSGSRCTSETTWERCVEGMRQTIECARYYQSVGDRCITGASRSDCGGDTCNDGDPPRCEGTHVVRCDSGITEDVDCARLGLSCVVSASGPICAGEDDPTCTTERASRCDGDTLRVCRAGRDVGRRCDAIVGGLECFESGGASYCGLGTACEPSAPGSCDGTNMTFCAGGEMRTVDCTTLGFTRCVTVGSRTVCAP